MELANYSSPPGKKKSKDYKGYTGKNPKTEERVQIKPMKLPFFNCGKELKERVKIYE